MSEMKLLQLQQMSFIYNADILYCKWKKLKMSTDILFNYTAALHIR